jgi:hypothetical protein
VCVCQQLYAIACRSLLWSLPPIVFVYSAAGCQVTPQITSFVRQTLILFDEIPAPSHLSATALFTIKIAFDH